MATTATAVPVPAVPAPAPAPAAPAPAPAAAPSPSTPTPAADPQNSPKSAEVEKKEENELESPQLESPQPAPVVPPLATAPDTPPVVTDEQDKDGISSPKGQAPISEASHEEEEAVNDKKFESDVDSPAMIRSLGEQEDADISEFNTTNTFPFYDVIETENKIVIYSDLPGMKDGTFGLEFSGKDLIIKGERNTNGKYDHSQFILRGRQSGEFRTVIHIPRTLDRKSVRAEYHNGILVVKIKKKKKTASNPVRITF